MGKFKEKNYAFIDSQNLNLSIQDMGWKLDFKRFRKYLEDKYHAKKSYIFIGYIPSNERLYTALQEYGYIIIFKPVLQLKNSKIKGNVDAELVLHTMIEYPRYDKAIIVSGDGDFACLVDYLISKEKLKKLIIPNRYKYSSLLKKFMKHIAFMNKLRGKL